MDFELVVVQGRSTTTKIKLNDGITLVGRHNDCQLRIKSSQVSRKHCELFEKKGLLLVKDLNSSNGTVVNGKRIQGQRVLEPGDELGIGPILLRVAKIAAAATAGAEEARPGVKASDTAVTAAIAAGDEGDSGDFTVDIDEPTLSGADAAPAPARTASKAKPQAPVDDDFADFLIEIPTDEDQPAESSAQTQAIPLAAAADPQPQAKAAAKPAEKPASAPEPAPEPGEHDDAIADFLLDIQIDEDE
jgi:predicted component of type VI protein secretion system